MVVVNADMNYAVVRQAGMKNFAAIIAAKRLSTK